jgi:hypothetical protein
MRPSFIVTVRAEADVREAVRNQGAMRWVMVAEHLDEKATAPNAQSWACCRTMA